MKVPGPAPIDPIPPPLPIIRVEGRVDLPVTLKLGERLSAVVERALPDGRALLNFGSFSLVARTSVELPEGSPVQLTLERFTPVMELRLVRAPVVPGADDIARAIATLIRDRAPAGGASSVAGTLSGERLAAERIAAERIAAERIGELAHPAWAGGLVKLSNAIRVLQQETGIGAERMDTPAAGETPRPPVAIARDVASAVRWSGLFLEARAMMAARQIAPLAGQITTAVDKFIALLGAMPVPPAGTPAALVTSTATQEIRQLLAAFPGVPGGPVELAAAQFAAAQLAAAQLAAEALASASSPMVLREAILGRVVERAQDLLVTLSDNAPEGLEKTVHGMRRELAEIKSAGRDARRVIAELTSHASSDRKAVLLQMLAVAREAGRADLAAGVEAAVKLIESYQGAALAPSRSVSEEPFLLIPLPVSTPGGREVAELKVYYRGEGGKPVFDTNDLSVSLLLRLSHLGRVRADASIAPFSVRCSMWVESPAVQGFVDRHIDKLRSSLAEAGFKEVTVTAALDARRVEQFHDFRRPAAGPSKVLDLNI